MPRQTGLFVENNFVRGLITEATSLSFPENACFETYDCEFKKTGEVVRRSGFNYESSYSLFTLTASRNNSAISNYLWTGAGGDGNSSFIVQQVGRYIYFYAIEERALSPNKHATSIDLANFDISGYNYASYACDFAQGDGKLFVVGEHIEPFYVTYTPSTDTISSGTQITIEIRDFKGDTNDTYDPEERPTAAVATTDTAAVNAHIYNLLNQGWGEDVYTDTPGQASPLKDWDSATTTIPSNSDRWWQLKNVDDQFDMGELDKYPVTSGLVPKGHFIFNAFNVNRGGIVVDGTSFNSFTGRTALTNDQDTLQDEATDKRPTQVTFFSNRIFYGGVNDAGYNDTIYFSQLLTDVTAAGKCYQQNDPTHQDFFDLLPTDGGTIKIPDIAKIVWMEVIGDSLIVFATNGIWSITGSDGIGFTAVDFYVRKVSSIRCAENKAYVTVPEGILFANSEGIWLMPIEGGAPQNITKDTIQTFYEEIPLSSLPFIKGVYNGRTRKVYFLYKSVEADGLDDNYQYNRCLVLNMDTGAFYPWKLNTDSTVKVLDACVTYRFFVSAGSNNVTVGGDQVQDSNLDNVVISGGDSASIVGDLKFLTENASNQITWSEVNNTDYLDWVTPKSGTGVDYESYFITGYKIRGEALRTQQTTYIRVHSRVEENSSLKVQGVWDTYTSDGVRWSTEQQAYKARTGSTYVDRRLKIRGNGLALQIKFKSEEGKPFNCIGWSTEDSISVKP